MVSCCDPVLCAAQTMSPWVFNNSIFQLPIDKFWQQYGWHPSRLGDAMVFLVVKWSIKNDILLSSPKTTYYEQEVGWTLFVWLEMTLRPLLNKEFKKKKLESLSCPKRIGYLTWHFMTALPWHWLQCTMPNYLSGPTYLSGFWF